MREQTKAFIKTLHEKDQKELRGSTCRPRIEEIEDRLADEREVFGVIEAGMHSGGRTDVGVVLVSSYGLHCAGRDSRYDWAWSDVNVCQYGESGILRPTGEVRVEVGGYPEMRFSFSFSKIESARQFAAALDRAMGQRPKL